MQVLCDTYLPNNQGEASLLQVLSASEGSGHGFAASPH